MTVLLYKLKKQTLNRLNKFFALYAAQVQSMVTPPLPPPTHTHLHFIHDLSTNHIKLNMLCLLSSKLLIVYVLF